MTKYIKAGGIKVQISPFYVCSCGKSYRSLAWAKKCAAKHDGTIRERSPLGEGAGKLYLIAPENLNFRTLEPLNSKNETKEGRINE